MLWYRMCTDALAGIGMYTPVCVLVCRFVRGAGQVRAVARGTEQQGEKREGQCAVNVQKEGKSWWMGVGHAKAARG